MILARNHGGGFGLRDLGHIFFVRCDYADI